MEEDIYENVYQDTVRLFFDIFFSYFSLNYSLFLDTTSCTLFTVIGIVGGCLGRHLLEVFFFFGLTSLVDVIDLQNKEIKLPDNTTALCNANHTSARSTLTTATLPVSMTRNQ